MNYKLTLSTITCILLSTLAWAQALPPNESYLGSLNDDYVSILIDMETSLLVCGHTYSSDSIPFPSGPSYSSLQNDSMLVNGSTDIFISSMSKDIALLHYSIFFGGSGNEQLHAAEIYQDSMLVVMGSTDSEDLWTSPDAFQSYLEGERDLFVTVFNLSQSPDSAIYSTYLGGFGQQYGCDMLIDSQGQIHIVGNTDSPQVMSLSTFTLSPSFGGNCDAFWCSLSLELDSLLSFTMLGGEGLDYVSDLTLDSDSTLYILLNTDSPSAICLDTISYVAPDMSGRLIGIDLAEMSCTYERSLGGSSRDLFSAMTLFDGTLLFTGATNSSNFPIEGSALYSTLDAADEMQAFVMQLNPSNDSLMYSTYIGGAGIDMGMEISIEVGYPTVLGQTDSYNFPTMGGPYQPFAPQERNVFMCRFDSTLVLNGSTTLGRNSIDRFKNQHGDFNLDNFDSSAQYFDRGTHCMQDSNCLVIAFHINSQDILEAPGGLDFLPNAEQDGYFYHFGGPDGPCGPPCENCICTGSNADLDNYLLHVCGEDAFSIEAETNMLFPLYQWYSFDGMTVVALEDDTVFSGCQTESLTILQVDESVEDMLFKCHVNNTFKEEWFTAMSFKYHEELSNPVDDYLAYEICPGDSFLVNIPSDLEFIWQYGIMTDESWIAPLVSDSLWVMAQSQYCESDTSYLHYTVFPDPIPLLIEASDPAICSGDSTLITVSGAAMYQWSTGADSDSIMVAPSASSIYRVEAMDLNGCTISDSTLITVNTPPTLSASTTNETCHDNDDGSISLDIYTPWDYYILWADSAFTDFRDSLSEGTYTVRVYDENTCYSELDVTVVNDSSDCQYIIYLPTIFSPNGDGNNDLFRIQGREINNADLTIFDPLGGSLHTAFLDSEGWDGNASGVACPQGVYSYRIRGTFNNGESFDRWGDISLVR